MENVREVVRTLHEQYTQAYVGKDLEMLDGLLADDWTLTTVHGRISDKSKQLGYLKSGDLVVDSASDSEVLVRVYGNAAVTTGVRKSKVMFRRSNLSDRTRFTQCYALQNGSWRCVATHVSSIHK